jgi:nitroimidazol reductase NimA-like FMN-containing flavoprotein (pyridoxamine 5'-phosphate oxidase superfamily)
MMIHDMTRQASIELLARTRLGRLACAHEGQPYVTPIYYAYDSNYLYGFSTLGRKITWMRENPLVCMEADETASPQDWTTVVVFGKYEELPDTPQYEEHRKHAHDLLQTRAVWWEPGYVKTVLHEKTRPMGAIYFRIHIDQINGHRGVPDPTPPDREISARRERPMGWLRKILGRTRREAAAATAPRATP